MGYNSSSAYDLSRFEDNKPSLQVVERKASAKRTLQKAFTAPVIGAFVVILTMLSLIINNQAKLNEISGSINAVQAEISVLENNYAVMSSQLNALASLEVVSQKAREELGMYRLDQYQTKYVNLYGEDKILLSTATQDPEPSQGVSLAAQSWINRLLEYIP